MSAKAIVLGASGLVGSNVVDILARRRVFDEVLLLVRGEMEVRGAGIRQRVINFDNLDEYRNELNGNVIFSCLGTTRSQAPDNETYRRIDFEYPLQIAEAASKNGVEQFHIISSLGADKDSLNPYLKLKGELEQALKKIPFKSIHIYRPSVITGKRNRSRLADKLLTPVMIIINPLLTGKLKKYRSIEASVIAQAMINRALTNAAGVFIYESDQIQNIT